VVDNTASGSRYAFDLQLPEQHTESILTGHLDRYGGTITRGTRLVALAPGDSVVTATLEDGEGRRDVTAAWVVGCDGFHSASREMAGIDFPGTDAQVEWAVFDCSLPGWERGNDFGFALDDESPVILLPLRDDRWRLYLRPTSPTSDVVADAQRLVSVYGPAARVTDPEQTSRFHTHSRVAERYRAGRVLLAGDAAHVCSPSQGHGMNTGLTDAHNLGWKLALVCRGAASSALLDSYGIERRPAAVAVAQSGDKVEAGQLLTDPEARSARDAQLRASLADPGFLHHEAVAEAELDVTYADSPIVTPAPAIAADAVPAPGERLPETAAVVPPGGAPVALHELTHRRGHTVLVLGRAADAASGVADALAPLVGSSPLVDAVVGLAASDIAPGVGSVPTHVLDTLGVGTVTTLVVRPDRFVGCRVDGTDTSLVPEHLARIASGG
jgi:2-polyprenyl-6-methoxyphenol hydroxylase-like FAD-dependent oxidoreductase